MKLAVASALFSVALALPAGTQVQKRGGPSVHLVNCILHDESSGFGPTEAGLAFYYDDDNKVGRHEKYNDFGWVQAFSYPDWRSQRLWTNFVGNPGVRGWLEIVPSAETNIPAWSEVGTFESDWGKFTCRQDDGHFIYEDSNLQSCKTMLYCL